MDYLRTRGWDHMTKKVPVSFAEFLVVLLVMMEYSAITTLASVANVNIYNYVGEPIQLRCSHGAEQTLVDGQHFGWDFTPNIWGTTNYKCRFRWGARTAEFSVWVDDFVFVSVQKRPCTYCVWRVTKVGFYRSEYGEVSAVLIHSWLDRVRP